MSTKRREGFTLIEVLVILAILALLVGALVPTIANQARKGDVQAVSNDLSNLRTGLEAFQSDVRRYPAYLSHLSSPIVITDKDVNAVAYPAGLVARWKGPYISKDTLAANFPTGFGAMIRDTLRSMAYGNGVNYLTVTVIGISNSDFRDIDAQIDGDTVAGATKGLLRWSTGGGDTTRYMVMPIN